MKVKKTLLYSLLFLIAALQCLFLGSIIYEQQQHLYVFPFILLFTFLLFSYFHTYIREYHIQFDSWKGAIWIFIGGITVWYLRQRFAMDAVLATATLGTLAGSMPMVIPKNTYIKTVVPALYCGAFIGMSNIHNSFNFILLASTFAFFAYIFAKTIMNGIGGKLGTLAFVGVVLAYLSYYIVKWFI